MSDVPNTSDAPAQPAKPDRLLITEPEAAAMIGMSTRFIRGKISSGEFPQPVRLGSRKKFRKADIVRWIERL